MEPSCKTAVRTARNFEQERDVIDKRTALLLNCDPSCCCRQRGGAGHPDARRHDLLFFCPALHNTVKAPHLTRHSEQQRQ